MRVNEGAFGVLLARQGGFVDARSSTRATVCRSSTT